MVALDADLAETAARLRAATRLKLRGTIQAASTTLAINAAALATHDRAFDRVGALRVVR